MTDRHQFHSSILREYDIRGIVGETLHPADARAIGRAFGHIVRQQPAQPGTGGRRPAVALGYDGRLSSPELAGALAEGLADSGVDIRRIGRGPTPMLYYAVHECGVAGGIQVTGSHNPPDHNGFKMMLGRSSFFGERIRALGEIAARGDWDEALAGDARGEAEDLDIFESYVARLLEGYRADRPLTVAWDAGNGAAGEAMARVAAALPGRHVTLNAEIDGTFPNHHPDPTVPENLAQLQAAVAEHHCDLGIAFDGDGDRIGVVDDRGRILWGDQLMALLARDVLARHPGATIIADVKASQVLFDEITRLGGKPLMWKTGHSLVKSKMVETNAPLAGEMSGHIFYKDGYYGFDDALYVAIRLLDVLARGKEKLSVLRDGLPQRVNTPEIRFPCDEGRKFEIVADVARRLAAEGAVVNDIDGVRVTTEDGWWLLRASNTQAVLVARCEAADEAGLVRLKTQLGARLAESGLLPPDF